MQTINCSLVGLIDSGARACVVYGASAFDLQYPKIDEYIDIILYLPEAEEMQLRQWLSDLDVRDVPPVVSHQISLGSFQYASEISGFTIYVRNSNGQPFVTSCSILDSVGSIAGSLVLDAASTNEFAMPTNFGFGLLPGGYSVECTITNDNGDSVTAAVFTFQVIAFGNSVPNIASVTLLDEDGLLKIGGIVRDVNGSLTVVAGSITDTEDDFLGLPVTVETYVIVDGTEVDRSPNNTSTVTYPISNLGDSLVEIGFSATDSLGAYSSHTIGRVIHKNQDPDYVSGLANVGCLVGGSVTLPTPVFSDPEGDAYTYSYNLGTNGNVDCSASGDYLYIATAVDEYGASNQSPPFTISVSATNRPPTISRGSFTNATCYFGGTYFCYMNIDLPQCDDPDGNLAALPVVYDGYSIDGSYASGGSVTDEFSTGFQTISAYCVDAQGLTSSTLSTQIYGCVLDPIRGTCN